MYTVQLIRHWYLLFIIIECFPVELTLGDSAGELEHQGGEAWVRRGQGWGRGPAQQRGSADREY